MLGAKRIVRRVAGHHNLALGHQPLHGLVDGLAGAVPGARFTCPLAPVPATAVSPLPVRTLTLEEPIFLRSGTRQFFVPVSKIVAICAAGDYSEVWLHGQPPLEIRRRMSEWMTVLPGDSFLQIDRSLIVNRLLIRGVERLSRTNGRLLMDGIATPLQPGGTSPPRYKRSATTDTDPCS